MPSDVHRIATPAGAVTAWLPPGERFEPDPADAALLWWLGPGEGHLSLATGPSVATPADDLVELERGLGAVVDVERDELLHVGASSVRELVLHVASQHQRSWEQGPDGHRVERPAGRERHRIRRRFWLDAPLTAGYRLPDAGVVPEVYDEVLDSVRLEVQP